MADKPEQFQTDVLLNDLYVGDYVVYVETHNGGLSYGRIKKITPKGATIWKKTPGPDDWVRYRRSYWQLNRPTCKLVKIPEDRLAPLRLEGTLPAIDITMEKPKEAK